MLIEGGRIAAIGPDLTPPAGAQVVDATGKFAIPGLWDMHAHLNHPEQDLAVMVAHGITGVREMYTGLAPETLIALRGHPEIPRLVVSGLIDGPLLETGGALPPAAAAVSTADEATTAVQLLTAMGADFIKVYNSVPREAYFAIAAETRRLGGSFAGHVPEEISPKEAAEAGQLSQEHLLNLLLAASTNEDELRAARVRMMYDPEIPPAERARELAFPDPEGLFDTYDEAKAADLFNTFVDYGIWQTPTLIMYKAFAEGGEKVRKLRIASDLDDAGFVAFQERVARLFDRYMRLVSDMREAGVLFLAGTDASAETPIQRGVGLHQELELFVKSGMTEMEALQTATRNPGFYFGLLTLLGTLEQGKIADIVLLNANPLEDIRNTREIDSVILRGTYFSRNDLDQMLAAAE